MRVYDLVCNPTFDINANVAIYDGDKGCWQESQKIAELSCVSGNSLPVDILKLSVLYITVDNDGTIVIEAGTEK